MSEALNRVVVFFGLSLLLAGSAAAQGYKPGEVIVKFKSGTIYGSAVAGGSSRPTVVSVHDVANALNDLA